MIAVMVGVYLVLLFVLVQLGIVRFNLFWKVSPFIVLLLLNVWPVHSDGMGRAAGSRRWWCAIPSRSCPTSRAR